MKSLAQVPRGLLFGAPLALLIGISTLSILLARGAPSRSPESLPPIPAGAVLLVLHDDYSTSLGGGAALPSQSRWGETPQTPRLSRVASAVEQALLHVGHDGGVPAHPVVDAKLLWNELVYGEAPLNTGRIDAPIPSVWPAELRPEWEQARALCIAQAGPRPYGLANLPAYLCGLKIAPVLWQRWLDHVRPTHVVTVEIHRTNPNDAANDGWNVEVSAYEPGSIDDYRLFRGEIRPSAVPEAAADLAARAMGGEGRIIRRTLEREMPDSPRYHAFPAVALPNDGIPVRPKP